MTEQLSIVSEPSPRELTTAEDLRTMREALGLSVAGAASQMRLAARQVEALERGDWDSLPGLAFVKGALRSYGRLLNADASPLITSLDQQVVATEIRADRSLEGKLPERSALGFGEGGKGSRWAWIFLALVGLGVIALYFGQGLENYIPKSFAPPQKPSLTAPLNIEKPAQGSDLGAATTAGVNGPASSASGTGVSATSNASSGTAPMVPAPATTLEPSPAQGQTNTASPSSSSNVDASSSAGAPVALGADARANGGALNANAANTSASNTSASNTNAANGPGYRIEFLKESWVEILDAKGERVMYGTQAAGSIQMLKGSAPFQAVIGNAQHVRIDKKSASSGEVEKIPLGSNLPQGIARLTLK
jgi:cytoskeleton protein RodZ